MSEDICNTSESPHNKPCGALLKILPMMKVSLLFAVCLAMSLSGFAQQGAVSAGGDATQLSYSIGLPFYTHPESASGSAYQGHQQPYEISIVTSVPGRAPYRAEVNVYPNPVMHTLTIKGGNAAQAPVHYAVYSTSGQLVEEQQITSWPLQIDAARWAAGTYYLQLADAKNNLDVLKIQKQK